MNKRVVPILILLFLLGGFALAASTGSVPVNIIRSLSIGGNGDKTVAAAPTYSVEPAPNTRAPPGVLPIITKPTSTTSLTFTTLPTITTWTSYPAATTTYVTGSITTSARRVTTTVNSTIRRSTTVYTNYNSTVYNTAVNTTVVYASSARGTTTSLQFVSYSTYMATSYYTITNTYTSTRTIWSTVYETKTGGYYVTTTRVTSYMTSRVIPETTLVPSLMTSNEYVCHETPTRIPTLINVPVITEQCTTITVPDTIIAFEPNAVEFFPTIVPPFWNATIGAVPGAIGNIGPAFNNIDVVRPTGVNTVAPLGNIVTTVCSTVTDWVNSTSWIDTTITNCSYSPVVITTTRTVVNYSTDYYWVTETVTGSYWTTDIYVVTSSYPARTEKVTYTSTTPTSSAYYTSRPIYRTNTTVIITSYYREINYTTISTTIYVNTIIYSTASATYYSTTSGATTGVTTVWLNTTTTPATKATVTSMSTSVRTVYTNFDSTTISTNVITSTKVATLTSVYARGTSTRIITSTYYWTSKASSIGTIVNAPYTTYSTTVYVTSWTKYSTTTSETVYSARVTTITTTIYYTTVIETTVYVNTIRTNLQVISTTVNRTSNVTTTVPYTATSIVTYSTTIATIVTSYTTVISTNFNSTKVTSTIENQFATSTGIVTTTHLETTPYAVNTILTSNIVRSTSIRTITDGAITEFFTTVYVTTYNTTSYVTTTRLVTKTITELYPQVVQIVEYHTTIYKNTIVTRTETVYRFIKYTSVTAIRVSIGSTRSIIAPVPFTVTATRHARTGIVDSATDTTIPSGEISMTTESSTITTVITGTTTVIVRVSLIAKTTMLVETTVPGVYYVARTPAIGSNTRAIVSTLPVVSGTHAYYVTYLVTTTINGLALILAGNEVTNTTVIYYAWYTSDTELITTSNVMTGSITTISSNTTERTTVSRTGTTTEVDTTVTQTGNTTINTIQQVRTTTTVTGNGTNNTVTSTLGIITNSSIMITTTYITNIATNTVPVSTSTVITTNVSATNNTVYVVTTTSLIVYPEITNTTKTVTAVVNMITSYTITTFKKVIVTVYVSPTTMTTSTPTTAISSVTKSDYELTGVETIYANSVVETVNALTFTTVRVIVRTNYPITASIGSTVYDIIASMNYITAGSIMNGNTVVTYVTRTIVLPYGDSNGTFVDGNYTVYALITYTSVLAGTVSPNTPSPTSYTSATLTTYKTVTGTTTYITMSSVPAGWNQVNSTLYETEQTIENTGLYHNMNVGGTVYDEVFVITTTVNYTYAVVPNATNGSGSMATGSGAISSNLPNVVIGGFDRIIYVIVLSFKYLVALALIGIGACVMTSKDRRKCLLWGASVLIALLVVKYGPYIANFITNL